MKPSPAFQFYPQDFLVGTADMTAEEVGGYIRLLCYQWAKGSIPNDDRKLSQLSGISDGLSLGNVSVKFRLCEDGQKRNNRLESVRIQQDQYRQKQAENGKKGGNPNFIAGKPNPYHNPPINPLDNPYHNPEINTSSSSSTSNKKRASKSQISPELFIEQLKANPIYSHINIDRELGKMDAWILANPGRVKNKRFVLGWLNKIEVPIGPSKASATKGPSGVFNDPLIIQP